MIYSELKAELRPLLFASGEQENLIAPHDAFFNEALYDLVKHVPCLQFNHTDVFDHCATYFSCGMTVLPKPPGVILRLYVIDRINPETGEEDPTADEDWCSKVQYNQVEFCEIQKYVSLCQRCGGTSVASVADALIASLFGIWRIKKRYPAPTDEGLESLPPLPNGMHYPQASTDAAGRSPGGVWANYRGRIYVAPWIQSTESVVIEWNGLKAKWNDADFVDDDIKFKQAVRLHVAMQHEGTFGEASRAAEFRDQFYGNPRLGIPGALPTLIHECREQNRVVTCQEAGSGMLASARKLGNQDLNAGTGSGPFYNDQQFQYTATCPTGQTGGPVTVIVAVGTVASALSVADANAKASAKAQADAQAGLVCETAETTYFNTQQQYTHHCPEADGDTPAATGEPFTATVDAGEFSSTVSQAAADAAAFERARQIAESQAACTFYNAPQSHTAECPDGTAGSDVTVDIPAGQHTSTISQDDANEKAKVAAQQQAEQGLSCTGITFMVFNSTQSHPKTGQCVGPNGQVGTFTKVGTIPGNTYHALATAATQLTVTNQLNLQAKNAAIVLAEQLFAQACNRYRFTGVWS